MSCATSKSVAGRTLKPGVSSTFSCAAGGTPFSVTGAAGASDIGGTNWWVLEDELDEPVSSCQTWGLRKKRMAASETRFLISGKTPLYYVAMTAPPLFWCHLSTISSARTSLLRLASYIKICLTQTGQCISPSASSTPSPQARAREMGNYRALLDR